jgi:uncharacterized protein (TIGR02246 family)
MLRRSFALALLLFAALTASAQHVSVADGLRLAVLRSDEARVHAMLAADTGALGDLMTDDCLYVHSHGGTQTKAEFLAALRTGAMQYQRIQYEAAPLVRLFGSETAVLTGTARIEVRRADGTLAQLRLRITAVYVARAGVWQLASYQSTAAPAEAKP